MATRAQSDLLPREDKVKTLRKLIFLEMWEAWADRDIKCQAYKDEVKRRFAYHASKRYGLTWHHDRGQCNNHLSSVFRSLNKSIRAAQKRHLAAQIRDRLECLYEDPTQRWFAEMIPSLQQMNHHVCEIEGYPSICLEPD